MDRYANVGIAQCGPRIARAAFLPMAFVLGVGVSAAPLLALSDLVVQSISVTPASGAAGSGATVSVTLRNQGPGTASSSTTRLRINTSSLNVTTSDPILTEVGAPSIASGQTYSANIGVTIPSSRPSGTNYIWAIADAYNTANQSDITNDRGATAFTVQGAPQQSDWVVQSISVTPASGAAGSGATESGTLRNQGPGSASSSTTQLQINTSSLNVTTSDPILTEVGAPSIASGQTYSANIGVTIPSSRPSGTNYIWAIADAYNTANQSDITNDRGATAFTVQSAPQQSDLVVQSISVTPASGAAGSGATVSVTLRNQGPGTASSSTTRLRINTSSLNVTTSDPILTEVGAPSIASGQTYSANIGVTIPSSRPSGTNYIWATADAYNTANQSDITNDRGATAFTVQSAPQQSDLVVQSISVTPASGAAGSGATVSVTLRNQGPGTASSSTTRLRINTSSLNVTTSDPILTEVGAPSIASGQTYSANIGVTIPSSRPSGTNYIWATAD